jgi:hypothetical protein
VFIGSWDQHVWQRSLCCRDHGVGVSEPRLLDVNPYLDCETLGCATQTCSNLEFQFPVSGFSRRQNPWRGTCSSIHRLKVLWYDLLLRCTSCFMDGHTCTCTVVGSCSSFFPWLTVHLSLWNHYFCPTQDIKYQDLEIFWDMLTINLHV